MYVDGPVISNLKIKYKTVIIYIQRVNILSGCYPKSHSQTADILITYYLHVQLKNYLMID